MLKQILRGVSSKAILVCRTEAASTSSSAQAAYRLTKPRMYNGVDSNGVNGTKERSPLRNGFQSSSSPFLIGVAGGTASGKSTVCEEIIRRLGEDRKPLVGVMCQDAFYRELSGEEKAMAYRGDFNFDHPDALDYDLMIKTFEDVVNGKKISVPVYDFRTHSRVPNEKKEIGRVDVLLVEGILVFYFEEIRDLFDMKLFVDTDPDTRLARRVVRDIRERGRDLEHVLHQYLTLVKPAYEEFCLPTKKYADVIIPRGAENHVAIELIVKHIQELLRSPRNKASEQRTTSRSRCVSESFVPTARPH